MNDQVVRNPGPGSYIYRVNDRSSSPWGQGRRWDSMVNINIYIFCYFF